MFKVHVFILRERMHARVQGMGRESGREPDAGLVRGSKSRTMRS